jgi:hypothetical protein
MLYTTATPALRGGGLLDSVKDMVSGGSEAGLDENGHYTLVLVRHGLAYSRRVK